MIPTREWPEWCRLVRSFRRSTTLIFTIVFFFLAVALLLCGLYGEAGTVVLIYVVLISIVNALFLCAEKSPSVERGTHAVLDWLSGD
jgi:4-hydroxybenzoate polyprenyltransferase